MSSLPVRKGDLVRSTNSDGWTVYVAETDSLHALNASAKAIWELCDGDTKPQEMALAIAELTGATVSDALSTVHLALDRLERLSLIENR